jgi:predicted dehydrogenase
MRIGFNGKLSEDREIRAGFVGCGSHSFRNVYPTFQFAPVKLVATCDMDLAKAQAFAQKFGAANAYTDYRKMLAAEKLDAVFIVTGYDQEGRPTYPDLTIACLQAGCHVWMEKPPAATCADIDRMRAAAAKAGKNAMVGMKKMFFPGNEKAKELMALEDFGQPMLINLQYPQRIPTVEEFHRYLQGRESLGAVIGFLDHLCHPVSLLLFLAGMPKTLYYERATSGAGSATFTFESGLVATLLLTNASAHNGGMERTLIVGDRYRHIVVDNNIRVTYHRTPPLGGYGAESSFFRGTPGETTATWEPEFSLGQLYNKGLFLLGYYNEVNEFARSILESRPPAKATLNDAWNATRIFEAFAEGPGKVINL